MRATWPTGNENEMRAPIIQRDRRRLPDSFEHQDPLAFEISVYRAGSGPTRPAMHPRRTG